MPLKKVTPSQSAMENVDFSNAGCVITREFLDLLLNNNQSLHQQLVDLNEKTVDQNAQATLHRLTDIMEIVLHSSTSATNLDSKMGQAHRSSFNGQYESLYVEFRWRNYEETQTNCWPMTQQKDFLEEGWYCYSSQPSLVTKRIKLCSQVIAIILVIMIINCQYTLLLTDILLSLGELMMKRVTQ